MTFMCLLGGLQVGGGCPPARSSCITAPASLSLTRWPEGPFRQEAGRATMINEACRAATNEFEGSAAGEVISALPPGFKPMASLETMPLRRRRRPPRIPSNGRRRRGRRALVRQRHRRDAGDGAEACGRQGSSSSRRRGEKWNTCSRGGGENSSKLPTKRGSLGTTSSSAAAAIGAWTRSTTGHGPEKSAGSLLITNREQGLDIDALVGIVPEIEGGRVFLI